MGWKGMMGFSLLNFDGSPRLAPVAAGNDKALRMFKATLLP
jgi:hypothetical protein